MTPKDYCCGRSWKVDAFFYHRAVIPRNNENSVRQTRSRLYLWFFSGIYGSRWQICVTKSPKREILYVRVFPASFSTCLSYFGFSKARLFATCSYFSPTRSPGRPPFSLSDPSRLIQVDSCYPATSCIPYACPLILVRCPLFENTIGVENCSLSSFCSCFYHL